MLLFMILILFPHVFQLLYEGVDVSYETQNLTWS